MRDKLTAAQKKIIDNAGGILIGVSEGGGHAMYAVNFEAAQGPRHFRKAITPRGREVSYQVYPGKHEEYEVQL